MILEPTTMSGEKTASAVIAAGPALIQALDILTPGTGTALLRIYDNASAASGTILLTAQVPSGVASLSINLPTPRRALKGLYASWTNVSGDAAYNVGFSLVW